LSDYEKDAPDFLVAAVIAGSGIGQAVDTTEDSESMLRMANYRLGLLKDSRTFLRFSNDDDELRWLDLWHKVETVEALEVLAHAHM
jgi:hypothetical protein